MFELFCSAAYVSAITLIWLETNVLYEYTKYFFKYDKYEKWIVESLSSEWYEGGIGFSDYIKSKNNFFSKLITCPMCLLFWLCVIYINTFGLVKMLPALYITALLQFYVLRFLKNE